LTCQSSFSNKILYVKYATVKKYQARISTVTFHGMMGCWKPMLKTIRVLPSGHPDLPLLPDKYRDRICGVVYDQDGVMVIWTGGRNAVCRCKKRLGRCKGCSARKQRTLAHRRALREAAQRA
jgi:hypothetical protein